VSSLTRRVIRFLTGRVSRPRLGHQTPPPHLRSRSTSCFRPLSTLFMHPFAALQVSQAFLLSYLVQPLVVQAHPPLIYSLIPTLHPPRAVRLILGNATRHCTTSPPGLCSQGSDVQRHETNTSDSHLRATHGAVIAPHLEPSIHTIPMEHMPAR
jgi:hypothetical protein